MAGSNFENTSAEYRQHLPDLSIPRFTISKEQDPYEYSKAFQETQIPPWLYNLTEAWKVLYQEPFIGVTNDGNTPNPSYNFHHTDRSRQHHSELVQSTR